MPVCHRRRWRFLHVPKTGGTSLVTALRLSWDGHHNPWYKFPDLQEYYVFTVVRDPIDRFVSEYNFGMSERSYWHVRGTPREFMDYQVLKDMTLHEIVEDLSQPFVARRLKHCGWWPQHTYICDDNGTLKVDYLLRQERLQADLDRMLTAQQHPRVPLPSLNRSEQQLSVAEVLSDAGLVKKLVELYARDYAALPYLPPYRVGGQPGRSQPEVEGDNIEQRTTGPDRRSEADRAG